MKNNKEWFLPDPAGIEPVGPFSTDEIIKKIKSGELSFDSYVSCPSDRGEKWIRVYQFREFAHIMEAKPICPPPKLFSKGVIPEAVVNADTSWKELDGQVILHNQDRIIKGELVSTNSREVKVESYDSKIEKGQELVFTLFASSKLQAFSASVAVVETKNHDDRQELTLLFMRMNPIHQRAILKLRQNQAEVV